MKKILLASVALTAFAGAAAAEVSFGGGSASLEYNDIDGVTYEADVAIAFSQALDNGYTAAASVNLSLADDSVDQDALVESFVVSLTSETAGLFYGETAVATSIFAGGSSLGNAPEADFDVEALEDSEVLRATGSFGGVEAAISYEIGAADTDLESMQFAANADLGGATVSVAYQDSDHDGDEDDGATAEYIAGEATAIVVAFTAGGADVNVGWLETEVDTTIGLGFAMTAGAVDLSGNVASNDVADDAWTVAMSSEVSAGLVLGAELNSDDTWEVTANYAAGGVTVLASLDDADAWDLEGYYDMSNGIVVGAGVDSDDNTFAQVNYDMGNGASAYVTYADAADINDAEDIAEGTTVGLAFAF